MLEENLKVTIDPVACTVHRASDFAATQPAGSFASKIVWTEGAKRLAALVGHCLRNNEAPLLVGETGSGKTTVCQLYGLLLGQQVQIINCHQHTETADFLGGLRPVRSQHGTSPRRNSLCGVLLTLLKTLKQALRQTNRMLWQQTHSRATHRARCLRGRTDRCLWPCNVATSLSSMKFHWPVFLLHLHTLA